jgi:hypothetical protein
MGERKRLKQEAIGKKSRKVGKENVGKREDMTIEKATVEKIGKWESEESQTE